MIRFESISEVACLKNSEGAIQKINELLTFIGDKGGKGEIIDSLVLKDSKLYFTLSVSLEVPSHCFESPQQLPPQSLRTHSSEFLKCFFETLKVPFYP